MSSPRQPQKPISETCGWPSIISQREMLEGGMQLQALQPLTCGAQKYSMPSAGPQRDVHV